LPEQTAAFLELTAEVAAEFEAMLDAAHAPEGVVVRAQFLGEEIEAEERGRAFWLELHSRCLDENLALELANPPADGVWGGMELPAASQPEPTPAAPEALALVRPEIPAATLYDLLRADDPELEQNLAETTRCSAPTPPSTPTSATRTCSCTCSTPGPATATPAACVPRSRKGWHQASPIRAISASTPPSSARLPRPCACSSSNGRSRCARPPPAATRSGPRRCTSPISSPPPRPMTAS